MGAMEKVMAEKRVALLDELRGYGRVVVAFSGGVDSTFVAAMAREALDAGATAITGVSPSVAPAERKEAEQLARQIGIDHEWVETHEMDNPEYVANSPMRCLLVRLGFAETGVINGLDEGDPEIVYLKRLSAR